MTSAFKLFEQELTRLNEKVGFALALALQPDGSPVGAQSISAFPLLLSDFYFLLQWLWLDAAGFDASQSQFIASFEEWMERVRGEEPSTLSVQGRVRLWTSVVRSESYVDHLREVLEPAPQSVRLLQDHDSVQGSDHAREVADLMRRFANWAVHQNVQDLSMPQRRLRELEALLPTSQHEDATSRGGAAQALGGFGVVGAETAADAIPVTTTGNSSGLGSLDDVVGVELDAVLVELDRLVGLNNVKAEVRSLVNLLRLNRLRIERGLPSLDVTRHMVFHGGPGTGKTTVARLLARIFKALGVLKKGHLVETDRSGLVAAYVGQTALKVKKVVNQADEGVLFIDEAYSLARGENDFGAEAIETLLKLMEDRRDSLVVIVAGYTDRMQTFIHANPGLKSRFTRYFNFEDYDASQLIDIFNRIAAQHGMHLSESALSFARERLQLAAHAGSIRAGNARFVRNCFEKATMAQADRLAAGFAADLADKRLSNDALMTLECSDIEWALRESLNDLAPQGAG